MATRQTIHDIRGLEIDSTDHVRGLPTAPVTLLEYGDFQCPHCGAAHPILRQLQREFEDGLRFVYRHFPLINIHPYALPAAEAAECAGAQNHFWEMHDWLFEHQDRLEPPQLVAAAANLDLDVAQFTDEFVRHVYVDRVQADLLSGVRAGVQGTPTFFINGVRHLGAWDFDTLSEAINAQLKGVAA